MNLNFTNIKEGFISFAKKLGNLSVLAICIVGGAAVGYYFNDFKNNVQRQHKAPVTLMITSTSVAVDESNNLIVIDKKTGDYSIYDDSVGIAVFNLYAHRMVSNITQNNTK